MKAYGLGHKNINLDARLLLAACLLIALTTFVPKAIAQNAGADQSLNAEDRLTAQTYQKLQKALDDKLAVREPTVYPNQLRSIFFTFWQHSLLQDAKRAFGEGSNSIADPFNTADDKDYPREITLGGISYINAEKWTVWLNSQRITPESIPFEILDIKVKDEYIDIKWFDGATNIIYPIRLRPHERFNLDSRIFFTGTAP